MGIFTTLAAACANWHTASALLVAREARFDREPQRQACVLGRPRPNTPAESVKVLAELFRIPLPTPCHAEADARVPGAPRTVEGDSGVPFRLATRSGLDG